MLEKMNDFFNSRIDEYEEHQLNAIAGAREFYPFTAKQLPMHPHARVLDLGCGTGLELGYYFQLNPSPGSQALIWQTNYCRRWLKNIPIRT